MSFVHQIIGKMHGSLTVWLRTKLYIRQNKKGLTIAQAGAAAVMSLCWAFGEE